MSRQLTTQFSTLLRSGHVDIFYLINLNFASGAAYFTTLPYPITYNGHTYVGAYGILSIEAITETNTMAQGLKLTFAGARLSDAATALNESVQGRTVSIMMAAIDPTGGFAVDTNLWTGTMDYITYSDTVDNPTFTVQAEHSMRLWDKPKPFRYTDAAQKKLFPTDKGLEFVAALSKKDIYWPTKEAQQ